MKTQERIISKQESRQQRNQLLAIYVAFITTLVISYSVVTALTVL